MAGKERSFLLLFWYKILVIICLRYTGFNRVKGELFDLPEQVLKILKETTNEEDDFQGNGVNGAKGNRPVTRQMVKPSDVNIKVPEWRPAPQVSSLS